MAMAEIALLRLRTRRRRPPSDRELLALLSFGALTSQTAWMGIQIARGNLLLLLAMPLYPLMWRLLRSSLETARHWERRGRPLPTGPVDWLLVAMLWLLQVLLWVIA